MQKQTQQSSCDNTSCLGFLIDYNSRFATEPEALFRNDIIEQIFAILISQNISSTLLIGNAGSGRTKLVKEIARRISARDNTVPKMLRKHVIYELSLASLVAGTFAPGQLETRLEEVLTKSKEQNTIIYIDDIHQLTNHTSPAYDRVCQTLKAALLENSIQIIGATTTQDATSFCADPVFNKRFALVGVNELSAANTSTILKRAYSDFEKHYGISIDVSLDSVVSAADENLRLKTCRPTNAINLLDRIFGQAVVSTTQTTLVAFADKDVESIARNMASGASAVHAVNFDTLPSAFSKIFGQKGAIDDLVNALKRITLGVFPQNVPNTLLLCGPSGAGKSLCANICAKALTDKEPITLNMAEYTSPATMAQLTGTALGQSSGQTRTDHPFDTLNTNPNQVVILEAFEKTHPLILQLFKDTIETGKMKTTNGKEFDFSKATIIAIANVGTEEVSKHSFGFTQTDDLPNTTQITASLKRVFSPDVLNSFVSVVAFNPIDSKTYQAIIKHLYAQESARITHDMPKFAPFVSATEDEIATLANDTYSPRLGARPAQNAVKAFIEDKLLSAQEG